MRTCLVFIFLTLVPYSANAELVVFNFAATSGTQQAGMDLDGLASGTSIITGSSFTVTLSAAANTGLFNLTGSDNFGINASGSGDDTDAFDDGSGTIETMTFSFTSSTPATFTFQSIDFDRITGTGMAGEDAGSLVFTSGGTYNFNGMVVDSNDLLTVGETFSASQTITLSFVAGNGFGLEAITLDVAAVPEPTTLAMFAIAMAGMGCRRRR